MPEPQPHVIERLAEAHYMAAQKEVELPSIPWSHLTQEKRRRMCRVMCATVRELEKIAKEPEHAPGLPIMHTWLGWLCDNYMRRRQVG